MKQVYHVEPTASSLSLSLTHEYRSIRPPPQFFDTWKLYCLSPRHRMPERASKQHRTCAFMRHSGTPRYIYQTRSRFVQRVPPQPNPYTFTRATGIKRETRAKSNPRPTVHPHPPQASLFSPVGANKGFNKHTCWRHTCKPKPKGHVTPLTLLRSYDWSLKKGRSVQTNKNALALLASCD